MAAAKRRLFIVPSGVVLVPAPRRALLSIALSLSAGPVRLHPLPIDPRGPVRPLGRIGRRSHMRPSVGTYITLAAN